MQTNQQERTTITKQKIGLLMSGGLDSSILLWHLLKTERRVQPFYVKCGLVWEHAELRAVQKYLAALNCELLEPLVVLTLPLEDIYERHWSVTGEAIPGCDSPDESVFLPGRNPLLAIKAAFWCQLNRVGELALATLSTDPFPDATPRFFQELESVLRHALAVELRLLRPFEKMSKRQVMDLGRDAPLHLTLSCISPKGDVHCGNCNKCVERQRAFQNAELPDRTEYANRRD